MARLILLEDERILREDVADYLSANGHQVTAVADLAAFQQCWAAQSHHIAILDLSLPDGDGMDLLRVLRRAGSDVGNIILTARSESQNRIAGLTDGADHYLTKPIRLNELLANVSALARRLGCDQSLSAWTLDAQHSTLTTPAGASATLSAREYDILRALIDELDKPVNRRKIVAALGEDFLAYDQRRLDTQMRRLRQKVLHQTGCELPIHTVHAVGYRFAAPALLKTA